MTKRCEDKAGPKYFPSELGIYSWRFRLRHCRFGKWNGECLGDIPNGAVMQLWESETARCPTGSTADALLGEVIRRGLIGTGNRTKTCSGFRSGGQDRRRNPTAVTTAAVQTN